MNHEQLQEAVSLYVAGALDASERLELEQHLETGCSVCEALLRDYQETVSHLPLGLSASPAPEALKNRILNQISQESSSSEISSVPRSQKGGFLQWLFAERGLRPSFAVLLVGALSAVMIYAVTLQSQLSERDIYQKKLQVSFEETSKEVKNLQTQLQIKKTEQQELQAQLSREVSGRGKLEAQIVRQTTELETLRSDLTARQQEMDLLRRTVSQKDSMLRFLMSPEVQVVSFKGKKDFPGEAILLYDPQEKWAYSMLTN